MEYMKEKKPCIDGIPLQYVCHLQDMKGTGMVLPTIMNILKFYSVGKKPLRFTWGTPITGSAPEIWF